MSHCLFLLIVFVSIPLSTVANIANDAKKLTQDETKHLLDQIAENQPSSPIKMTFRETRTSSLFKTPIESAGIIYFDPPNCFRKETTSSPQSIIVSNGKTLWMYYPAFKELETYSLQEKTPIASQLSSFLACLNLKTAQHHFTIEAWKKECGYQLILTARHRKAFNGNVYLELSNALRPTNFTLQTHTGDTIRVDFKTETPFSPPTNFFSF